MQIRGRLVWFRQCKGGQREVAYRSRAIVGRTPPYDGIPVILHNCLNWVTISKIAIGVAGRRLKALEARDNRRLHSPLALRFSMIVPSLSRNRKTCFIPKWFITLLPKI